MELFKKQTGTQIEHIPYNGVAPIMTALASGDLQATVMGAGAALPSVQGGKLRLLALDEKAALTPDVPTFKEAGFPDMRAPAWWAIAAPGGTPAPIIAQLNRDISAALREAEVREFLVNAGYEPVGDSPEFACRAHQGYPPALGADRCGIRRQEQLKLARTKVMEMAEIVGVVGMSHSPSWDLSPDLQGPGSHFVSSVMNARELLARKKPDALSGLRARSFPQLLLRRASAILYRHRARRFVR